MGSSRLCSRSLLARRIEYEKEERNLKDSLDCESQATIAKRSELRFRGQREINVGIGRIERIGDMGCNP